MVRSEIGQDESERRQPLPEVIPPVDIRRLGRVVPLNG